MHIYFAIISHTNVHIHSNINIYTQRHLKRGLLPKPSQIYPLCLDGKAAGPGYCVLEASPLSSGALMLHFCSRNLKSQQKSALGDEN